MRNLGNKYLTAAAVVLIIILGGSGYLYFQFQKTQTVKGSLPKFQQQDEKLVEEVSKLIELPTGENPTIATVTDIEKLKDQPFFQKAKNGDKVLIYATGKKAILYSPQNHKVIEVAPINIGTSSAQTVQPKLVLRNGTQTVGLTSIVEADLKKTIPALNVVSKEYAKKGDYENTTIVVFNNLFKETADNLLNLLKGAKLSDLPDGEIKPKEADILIILGKDRI